MGKLPKYEIDLIEGEVGDIPSWSRCYITLEDALQKSISLIQKGENGWNCCILDRDTGESLFTVSRFGGLAVIDSDREED